MTMVAFNLPSKLSQMVAFNLPSKLSQMVAFNLPSISSRTSKNPLKSQNPLSKEIDEMRNRMREMGVKECFNLLPNPRLPFPCFISPKKKKKAKKKTNFFLLMRTGLGSSGSVFFPLGAFRERPGSERRIYLRGIVLPKNAFEGERPGNALRSALLERSPSERDSGVGLRWGALPRSLVYSEQEGAFLIFHYLFYFGSFTISIPILIL
jgi:hypothetical protein